MVTNLYYDLPCDVCQIVDTFRAELLLQDLKAPPKFTLLDSIPYNCRAFCKSFAPNYTVYHTLWRRSPSSCSFVWNLPLSAYCDYYRREIELTCYDLLD